MACFCKNDNESCGFVNSGEFLGDLLACKLAYVHRGVFEDIAFLGCRLPGFQLTPYNISEEGRSAFFCELVSVG